MCATPNNKEIAQDGSSTTQHVRTKKRNARKEEETMYHSRDVKDNDPWLLSSLLSKKQGDRENANK